MDDRSTAIPPGIHLRAEVSHGHHQLRILGDEARGFLLAGTSGLPPADAESALWFASVEEAMQAAQEFGVELTAWTEIKSVGEASPRSLA